MFGFKKQDKAPINVEFYKKAAYHTPSGRIIVSNRRLKLVNTQVDFALPDLGEDLPPITSKLIAEIEEAALVQGYISHGIVKYGKVMGEKGEPASNDNDLSGDDVDLPGVLGNDNGVRAYSDRERDIPSTLTPPAQRRPFLDVPLYGNLSIPPDSLQGRHFNYDTNAITFNGAKINVRIGSENLPEYNKYDVFSAGGLTQNEIGPYIDLSAKNYWSMGGLFNELHQLLSGRVQIPDAISTRMIEIMYDFLVAIQAPPTIGLQESAQIIAWNSMIRRNDKFANLGEAAQPLGPIPTTGIVKCRGKTVIYLIGPDGIPGYRLSDIVRAVYNNESITKEATEGIDDQYMSADAIFIHLTTVSHGHKQARSFEGLTAYAAFLREVCINDLDTDDREAARALIDGMIEKKLVDENVVLNQAGDERFALKA